MAIRSIDFKNNNEILYIEDILTHEQIWSQTFQNIQEIGAATEILNNQIKILEQIEERRSFCGQRKRQAHDIQK
jgi:hypothetical protein